MNSDDGVIRGIEVKTGKVVSVLKEEQGGHEVGSKVRTLWAGVMRGGKDEEGVRGEGSAGGMEGGRGMGKEREILISGGFDKRVIVWECDGGSGS